MDKIEEKKVKKALKDKMDKIEEKELKKLLKEVTRLYKKHTKEGYEYVGSMFEDCQDGNEVQEVLMFDKY